MTNPIKPTDEQREAADSFFNRLGGDENCRDVLAQLLAEREHALRERIIKQDAFHPSGVVGELRARLVSTTVSLDAAIERAEKAEAERDGAKLALSIYTEMCEREHGGIASAVRAKHAEDCVERTARLLLDRDATITALQDRVEKAEWKYAIQTDAAAAAEDLVAERDGADRRCEVSTVILPTRDCACGYCPEVGALHRAALVRQVLAEQWAVAIALHDGSSWFGIEPHIDDSGWARRVAALPCADAVVADRLGER